MNANRHNLGSPECSSQGEDARSHWVGWGLHISKMLKLAEDAHIKSMSTFEVDEHRQELEAYRASLSQWQAPTDVCGDR